MKNNSSEQNQDERTSRTIFKPTRNLTVEDIVHLRNLQLNDVYEMDDIYETVETVE